jgi:hypothetical protein
MKDEELNNRSNTDSEWNWIKQNAGHYRDNVRNLIGNERVRVTFSDKMEDSTEIPSKESTQTNYYKDQVNKQTANRTEQNNDKIINDKPVRETPQQEIENPEPPQKPEKGNGGEEKKDKPEIRYDLD